jgi:ABC-2 type transport system permease protein
LFVDLILEWIVLGLITWKSSYETAQKVQDFFPLTSMSNLIKQPFQRIAMTKFPSNTDINYDYAVHFDNIVIVLFWTFIFIFSSYKLLKKRDL